MLAGPSCMRGRGDALATSRRSGRLPDEHFFLNRLSFDILVLRRDVWQCDRRTMYSSLKRCRDATPTIPDAIIVAGNKSTKLKRDRLTPACIPTLKSLPEMTKQTGCGNLPDVRRQYCWRLNLPL